MMFVGIEVTSKMRDHLASCSPEFVSLFIQENDPNFLRFREMDNSIFLGKIAEEEILSLETILSLAKHVESILRRLFPQEETSALFIIP